MTSKEILTAALNRWGPELQATVAIEEMAELTKELCKHARGSHNKEAIAEEIADVYVMLNQMEILHNVEARVIWWYNAKLARLETRLEQEVSHASD